MGELDLRPMLSEVQAPPGFERMVLARVHEVKSGARPVRLRSLRPRLSWALGVAALAAVLVLVNFMVLPRGGGPAVTPAASLTAGRAAEQAVPVMDSVDYGREVRSISGDSSTVYILEQVSDNGTSGTITY